jgi:hypothetical protein
MLHENYAKRTRGWVALRGMWGKRSDPEMVKMSQPEPEMTKMSEPEMTKKAPIPKVTEEEARQIMEHQ